MSTEQLLDFKFTLACMYRSHDGDFYEFLEKPESVIVKCSPMPSKLILCGDWNIKNLQDSAKLQN